MGGTKHCSTGMLDGFFSYLFNGAGGSLRQVVMTSSDGGGVGSLTVAGASSNSTGCVAWGPSTDTTGMSTDYFVITSSGNNRVCTIGACSCDVVLNTNIASFVAIVADASQVRYATTCTTQTLTAGNKVNIGTWSITINQPS